MTVPTHASCDNNCNAHYTAKSGQIVVRANQYKNYQSCLWTIDVGTGNSIEFTFDKKAGFDVEFHHKCGYDKLHIFSGNMQGKPERVARFCGPKDGEKPFDGSGQIKETNGVMPFWDAAFDIKNSQAVIGFDVDQKNVANGFVLKWNTVLGNNVIEIDFHNVFEAHEYLEETLKRKMLTIYFVKDGAKEKYQAKIMKLLEKAHTAISNNPASKGSKKRRCAKLETESVTPEVVQQIKDVYVSRNVGFTQTVEAMINLLAEYLGNCRRANTSWPLKLEKLARGIINDSCPNGPC